jgi:hypothetical protein
MEAVAMGICCAGRVAQKALGELEYLSYRHFLAMEEIVPWDVCPLTKYYEI